MLAGGRPVSTVIAFTLGNDFGYNRRVRVLSALCSFPAAVGARGPGAGPRAARARLRRHRRLGLALGLGDAEHFYEGCDVHAVRFDRGDAPMHPSYEDRPDAPDRVFAALDDDAYEDHVAAWSRPCRRRAPPTPTSCTCIT